MNNKTEVVRYIDFYTCKTAEELAQVRERLENDGCVIIQLQASSWDGDNIMIVYDRYEEG